MTGFPPPDPVAEAFTAHFGPEFGAAFKGEAAFSLDPLRAALKRLGNPQTRLPPVIHIAGTNGKGSTAAFCRAILQAAGLRTHSFTQPHLLRTRERLWLAGAPIEEEAFLALIARVAALGMPLSHFEAQTACAFLAFAETPADAVVLEVGMGGRDDATNLIENPAVCLITMIGEDHMAALGPTLTAVAAHKAGIIKPRAQVITAPQEDPAVDRVFETAAMRCRAPLLMGGVDWTARREEHRLLVETQTELLDLPLPALSGAHQHVNAGLAVLGCRALAPDQVLHEACAVGMLTVAWPGRLQRLTKGPLAALAAGRRVMVDAGHNPDAGDALAAWVRGQARRVALVAGMLADKDAAGFLNALAPLVVDVTVVEPKGSRPAMPVKALARAAAAAGTAGPIAAADLAHAVTLAAAACGPGGVVLIAGSSALAAEAVFSEEGA